MPRQLTIPSPGETEITEYELEELKPDQIRIQTEFAAPKHGTESHAFLEDWSGSPRYFDEEYRMFLPAESGGSAFPHGAGNMAVGVVTETGKAVTRFKNGDRVYGHMPIREVQTVSSEQGRTERRIWSGFRESQIHLVPPGLTDEQIVLLDPAHFAIAAVRDANVRIGERVAVFGLGAIGLMIVQMALRSGASAVYAVDPIKRRRELAEGFGATETFDPTAGDAAKAIKDATSKNGVDVSIDASGAYAALHDAIRAVHFSGLVTTCSYYHGRGTPLMLGDEWHLTRVTVKSSMPVWGNPNRDHPLWDDERLENTVLDLMTGGALKPDGIVDPIVPFESCAEVYKRVVTKPEESVKMGVRF